MRRRPAPPSARRGPWLARCRLRGCAVVAQQRVERGLVVPLALDEALDDEHAREPELAAGELAPARRLDGDAPRRDDATAQLLTRFGVDHRDRAGEDHARTDERALADAGTLDDH